MILEIIFSNDDGRASNKSRVFSNYRGKFNHRRVKLIQLKTLSYIRVRQQRTYKSVNFTNHGEIDVIVKYLRIILI